jgi:Transposase IS66 family
MRRYLEAAIFRVCEDRHRDRLAELIGEEYEGIVCSDRWWAYDHLDPECRQACWQHLWRDFTPWGAKIRFATTVSRGLESMQRSSQRLI